MAGRHFAGESLSAGGSAQVRAVLNHIRSGADGDDDVLDDVHHFPAQDLDSGVPCRNPLDPAPYPESDGVDVSFPSLFLPAADTGREDGMAEAELKHSWHRLQTLISRCLETDSSPADTVDMVHAFYSEHIKASFSDAPDWTKKSIYQYIFRNYDRQAAEAIHAVNHTIEFLRTQLASRKDAGKVKLNAENVKLLLAATKVHSSLIDAKRKRDQK